MGKLQERKEELAGGGGSRTGLKDPKLRVCDNENAVHSRC